MTTPRMPDPPATDRDAPASPIRPAAIDPVRAAFPAYVSDLMPSWDRIPDEFKRDRGNRWVDLASQWFFQGLPSTTKFRWKEGIDEDAALRHLGSILGSWEPKHEHKEAAVAFLMSEWLDDVTGTES